MLTCPSCETLLLELDGPPRCPHCDTLLKNNTSAPSQTPDMLPRLVLRGLGENVVEYPLSEARVVIGRSTSATIQLSDREVSRRHTEVNASADEHILVDLGSSNGTFHNGRRLYGPVRLADGDEVLVGTTRLVYRAGERQHYVVRTSEDAPPVLAEVDAERVFLPIDEVTDVEALRRDYERLRIAHEFQKFIRIERDLPTLLKKILDIAFELIPAQNGVILLRDERTNELAVEAVRQQKADAAKILISETLLKQVARKRQGILTSDALQDERFNSSQSIVGLGVRSCMAVPLVSGSDLRGVMFLDSRERIGAFRTKDLDVLSAIASQAVIALENMKLTRTIEESAAKRAFLERFLSPQLTKEVENGRIELTKGGTLTELTVLFSDIRGFTTMSEHSPPQRTVGMLNEYFELMADCVFAYDGIVDKFIGDSVMALFGAPIKADDDAERAVRCAMLMQQKAKEFNEMRAARGQPPLAVGIGLHTGEAVVGVIGSTKRLEYTAIGDTVNVASRLCSAAEPDSIVLSDQCLVKAGPHLFPAEAMPPLHVKGRGAALKTHVIRL